MGRCVLNVLVTTILGFPHQRRERHAHGRVRRNNVPVLHVEPIPDDYANFVSSSRRNSNRMTLKSLGALDLGQFDLGQRVYSN